MYNKVIAAGIIAIDISTGKILLIRRGMNCNSPNCWSSPGGTYEDSDKHPMITAIREFQEETGCKETMKLSKTPFFINKNNHINFYNYVALLKNQFHVIINDESLGYEWASLDKLPLNLHPGFEEMINLKICDLNNIINQNLL